MNLNINQNYQPSFSAKIYPKKLDLNKIQQYIAMSGPYRKTMSPIDAAIFGAGFIGAGVIGKMVGAIVEDKGMSAEELSGRIMSNPANLNPEFFNKEVAYKYFANGKLKDFPEYVETGREHIDQLDDYDKKNKLNTLKYQEQIVDKILSEDTLINNPSIRKDLYRIVTSGYNWYIPDSKNDSLYQYLEDQTQERLKVLDAFAKNEKLQQNPIINEQIADMVCDVQKVGMGDILIEMLEKNTDNNDKNFFSNLSGLILNNIQPDLIRKVQSDKRLYNQLGSYTLYETGGTDKDKAEKMVAILDHYLGNYADSELVTKKISNVIWNTFINNYKEEDKVAFAINMMKELAEKENATKSETADKLCDRINTKLNDIFSGKLNDTTKTDIENVNNQIDIIRSLRTEIKDSANKYTDRKSKEALSWTLGTVIHRLDLMKRVREKLGWCTIGYADVTDGETNKEIFEMLK